MSTLPTLPALPDTAEVVAAIKQETPPPLATTALLFEHIDVHLRWSEYRLKEDNRQLRKRIAFWVGLGLAFEILVLVLFVAAQGVGEITFGEHVIKFHLQEWTFSVFTSAVLLQTFGLATIIVNNLFPENKGK